MRSSLSALALAALAACAPEPSPATAKDPPRPDARADLCRPAAPSSSPFTLTILGSGGPSSDGRGASGYLVSLDGTPRLLVDAGPSAFLRLGQLGVDLAPIDTLLLTHLHVDHSGDVPGFVKSRDLSSNDAMTFRIFGPAAGGDYPSTTAFVDRLFGAQGVFAYLPKFRNRLRFEVADLPTAVASGAPVHEVLRDGDLHVTSIAVDHGDVPAVAFRIEHAGHALVVSGDLASKNDDLVRLAAGADVLVYDTSVLDPPASPQPLYDLHTSPHRIGEVAAAARVRRLVLSHLTPQVEKAEAAVLSSIATTFTGPTRFAQDCLRLDVTSP